MEFILDYDRDQKILLITMGAVVTEASTAAAVNAVRSFVSIEDPNAGIADLSAVSRIEVSREFIKYAAARPPAIPDQKLCILVAPREVTYGMSRMFQILRGGVNFQVVHGMDEAFGLLHIQSLGFGASETPAAANAATARRTGS